MERLMWRGSREERVAERVEGDVKRSYLRSLGVGDVAGVGEVVDEALSQGRSEKGKEKDKETETEEDREGEAFWEHDEGLEELSKGVKDA